MGSPSPEIGILGFGPSAFTVHVENSELGSHRERFFARLAQVGKKLGAHRSGYARAPKDSLKPW